MNISYAKQRILRNEHQRIDVSIMLKVKRNLCYLLNGASTTVKHCLPKDREKVMNWIVSFRISYSLQEARSALTENKCTIVFNFPAVLKSINWYAIPKINMLHNLSCCETRFRRLRRWHLLYGSLNLAFRQCKLHNIFIFGMAYSCVHCFPNRTYLKYVIPKVFEVITLITITIHKFLWAILFTYWWMLKSHFL